MGMKIAHGADAAVEALLEMNGEHKMTFSQALDRLKAQVPDGAVTREAWNKRHRDDGFPQITVLRLEDGTGQFGFRALYKEVRHVETGDVKGYSMGVLLGDDDLLAEDWMTLPRS